MAPYQAMNASAVTAIVRYASAASWAGVGGRRMGGPPAERVMAAAASSSRPARPQA
jgi:hypothetical protein